MLGEAATACSHSLAACSAEKLQGTSKSTKNPVPSSEAGWCVVHNCGAGAMGLFFFDLFITSWWVAQELCFLAYSAPQA